MSRKHLNNLSHPETTNPLADDSLGTGDYLRSLKTDRTRLGKKAKIQ